MPSSSRPQWIDSAIWWHVYPLGALDADLSGQDRTCRRPLSALIPWLDHALGMGVNGLALGPIFQSVSHGYDTLDHFRIDERLGTLDDFHSLVAACHDRGVKVMLDGVFNHVSREHPLVRDPARAITDGWARDAGGGHLWAFEGSTDLVSLNHGSPQVRDLTVQIMNHWLDEGADAWRLDAAYAVPTDFWADVLPRVRAGHPDAFIHGEVIHGDYPQFVAAAGVDSVTQYELWKAIWSSIASSNMHELAWSLSRHNTFLEHFLPYTFVGNHDVTRIATQLAGHPAALSTVLLATLPGTPAVYYGDELGFTGLKEERPGGDDAVRQPLPEHPAADAPPVYRLHQSLFALRRRHPSVQTHPVEVRAVDQGAIVYRVGGDAGLVVALNAGPAAATVPFVAGSSQAEFSVHRDPDHARLVPGGWLIAEA